MKHANRGHNSEWLPRYQIKIQGLLDERWSGWFNGLTIRIGYGDEDASITTLTGDLDQSALHAILTRIGNMNLKLISVHQIDKDETETPPRHSPDLGERYREG